MKKKRNIDKMVVILAVVTSLLLMSAAGISYAAWNSELHIGIQSSTGTFDIRIPEAGNCEVYITNEYGEIQNSFVSSRDLRLDIDSRSKLVTVMVERTIFLEDSLPQNKMIMLEYPLEVTKESTVSIPRAIPVDFSKQSKEVATLNIERAKLVINETVVPGQRGLESLIQPLSSSVYREVGMKEDQAVARIYLKPRIDENSSLSRANISVDAAILQDIGLGEIAGEKRISAEIQAKCMLNIPLYIEQGH